MDALTGALENCIDWRSSQALPSDMNDDDDDDMKEEGEDEEEESGRHGNRRGREGGEGTRKAKSAKVDWGNVSFLQHLIEWANKGSIAIGHFGNVIKEEIVLLGALEVPTHLVRVLPALQNDVSSFNAKVRRIAAGHKKLYSNRSSSKLHAMSLPSLRQMSGVEALVACSASYRARFEMLLVLYRNIFDAPVSSVLFAPAEETRDALDALWSRGRGDHKASVATGSGSFSMEEQSTDEMYRQNDKDYSSKTSFDIFFSSKSNGNRNNDNGGSNAGDSSMSGFGVHTDSGAADDNEGWGLYNCNDNSDEDEEDGNDNYKSSRGNRDPSNDNDEYSSEASVEDYGEDSIASSDEEEEEEDYSDSDDSRY